MGVRLVKLIPLIDQKQIAAKISEISHIIDREYSQKDLVILMVLKGALCLVADLIRAIHIPCGVEVIQCKSYGHRGTKRGSLEILGLDLLNIEGRDVLIVDDIFDSGQTLSLLMEALLKKHPRSLKSLVLLFKKVERSFSIRPDFVLFEIHNQFVVGYGLDFQEQYRNLSGIFILEES